METPTGHTQLENSLPLTPLLNRFDSGFRDCGSGDLEQEPHLEKAINAVRFVAQHVKNQDRYNKVGGEKISRGIVFFGPRPFTVV